MEKDIYNACLKHGENGILDPGKIIVLNLYISRGVVFILIR